MTKKIDWKRKFLEINGAVVGLSKQKAALQRERNILTDELRARHNDITQLFASNNGLKQLLADAQARLHRAETLALDGVIAQIHPTPDTCSLNMGDRGVLIGPKGMQAVEQRTSTVDKYQPQDPRRDLKILGLNCSVDQCQNERRIGYQTCGVHKDESVGEND